MVINGILFRTRTGCRGVTCPGSTGTGRPLITGIAAGRWTGPGRRSGPARAGCDEAEGADWTLSADSTVIRVHQHAAGARHQLAVELVTGGIAE